MQEFLRISVANLSTELSYYEERLSGLGVDWEFIIIVAAISHDNDETVQLVRSLKVLDDEMSSSYIYDTISGRDNLSIFHMMSTEDKEFLEWVFINVISDLHKLLANINFKINGYVLDARLIDAISLEYTVELYLPVVIVPPQ